MSERKEALRLAKEAGFDDLWTEKWYAQWITQLVNLIRLARQSAPQGEPVATLRITELLREDAHFLERCRPTSPGIAERLREAANAIEACHAANLDLLSRKPTPAQPDVVRDALLCGHPVACNEISAETGEVLYCGWCNAVSFQKDLTTDALVLLQQAKAALDGDFGEDKWEGPLIKRIDAALNHQSPLKNEASK